MPTMTATVTWNEIVAECGNYKSGFVAVFRKYEDQPTDERDASNRVITVNQGTFADHVGIPRSTFKDWVRREVEPEFGSTSARQARTAASHTNVAKNLARNDPSRLVEAIELAGPDAVEVIFDELKKRRNLNQPDPALQEKIEKNTPEGSGSDTPTTTLLTIHQLMNEVEGDINIMINQLIEGGSVTRATRKTLVQWVDEFAQPGISTLRDLGTQ